MKRKTRLGLLADGILVVGVLLTLWRLSGAWFVTRDLPLDAATRLVAVNDIFMLPGYEWSDLDRHVVLFVSPACAACESSAAYYSRLAKEIDRRPGTDLVVVNAGPSGSIVDWLAQKDIQADHMMEITPASVVGLGIIQVPTALGLEKDGLVTDIVQGRMTPDVETSFLLRVANTHLVEPVNVVVSAPEVPASRIADVLESDSQVVDIRERHEFERAPRPGAMNIPVDELSVRGPIELSKVRSVIIECVEGMATLCRSAGISFKSAGFTDVTVVMPR
ncbi:MAG: rhodanese-like domain-containing protein [Acidobacteria bacterium]|nr:rhodanese-like domain-containing protein [Acidobacteriota bacterium]